MCSSRRGGLLGGSNVRQSVKKPFQNRVKASRGRFFDVHAWAEGVRRGAEEKKGVGKRAPLANQRGLRGGLEDTQERGVLR